MHVNVDIDGAMMRSAAVASQMIGMGQTSSQILDHPPELPPEAQPRSSGKASKSKRSKRKGAQVESSLDPEQESARALLQMRGQSVPDTTTPYYDLAASQQLLVESSAPRLSGLPIDEATTAGYSERRRNHRNGVRKSKKKRRSGAPYDHSSSEERTEDPRSPQLPSTPPNQTERSPPPPDLLDVSFSQHALDDVPTDDETAIFNDAFGNESPAAEAVAPSHDMFSFSQQPPDVPDQQGEMISSYKLPTSIYTSPRAVGRPPKRKKDTSFTMDDMDTEQLSVENPTGQYMADNGLGSFDDLFQVDFDLADPFDCFQVDDVPIDPELHSTSALPPSVDLSALESRDSNVGQTKKRKRKPNAASQSSKRRRANEAQSANEAREPYHDPFTLQEDQENAQDQVLPGYEDHERRTSPELGTPFMEDLARGGLEYLNNVPKDAKSPHQGKVARRGERNKSRDEVNAKGYESARSLKDVSEKGGPFSLSEIAKLESFRERYCDANDMNVHYFNNLIQTPMRGDARVTALFNEIHEVLPYRPRMSVQKFVRRRFHNYGARGTWTAEEDDELRKAVEEKGKQWKVVGEMIERMPGDCRDRYRNYILNAEHRNREQWTNDEVSNLCRAILECAQLLRDQRREAREEKYGPDSQDHEEGSDQEAEDMKVINWQAVSDRMGEHGGGRSRLQCSFKWSELKKKDQNDLMNIVKEARGLKVKNSGPTKNPWRQRKALRKVANMRSGDQHALLQSIKKCNAPAEGNIPWRSLGDEDFRATWTVADRKSAWLTMRDSIAEAEAMDYREIVNQLITRIKIEHSGDIDERWDPEVHGDVSQIKPRKSKKGIERESASSEAETRRRDKTTKRARKQARSNEFIEETEDDEDAAIDQAQNYNLFDVLPRSAKANNYGVANDENASNFADDGVGKETAQGKNTDRDSLFDGSDVGSDYRPQNDRDISPELANRMIELL